MRTGMSVIVSPAVRRRLEALARNRNSPQKHVWRAKIILLSAEGVGTNEIMRQTGTSKTCVWRWQERFMAEGFDGLLRDKTRPSRVAPLGADVAERVVALTQRDPPAETTHWTAPMMATESASASVRFSASGARMGCSRTGCVSSSSPTIPSSSRNCAMWWAFMSIRPPTPSSCPSTRRAKSRRSTHPAGPADEKGRLGTMTHDYKRHGTTTLFAALDVLEGKVIGRCMQRHRHQEFIRFLNTIEAEVPAGKIVHVILDNYATHKHPRVRAWLARHERFVFHFTPTSCSWLNAVEGYFAKLSKRRLKRGVFQSVVDLQAAINRFIAETNQDPKPFTWTANPDKIIAAVKRGHQVLNSFH